MANIQVSRVTNASVYLAGNSLVGRAESVELPKVAFDMGDNKPLGLIGAFQTADEIQQMEAKFKWHSLHADVLSKCNPFAAQQFQVRASVAEYGPQGRTSEQPFVALITGVFREFPSIAMKAGDAVMPDSEVAVTYYKATLGGSPLIECDVLANKLLVGGTDVLAQRRANLGG
jgi:P2 family phage contractile tail tube protein